MAEAFFGSFKRDYVYQACLETVEMVGWQIPTWIDHYNQQASYSALRMQSPAEFCADWRVKNTNRPVQNKWVSTVMKSTPVLVL